jgi:Flp pilus assembly pilin Flp
MISRPMARRSPRGVTLVQVVVIVALIAMAVGGMTYAFFGQLSPIFGDADKNLAGAEKNQAANSMQQNQVTGHAASDPNAMQNSMQQNAQQNTNAAAKASGVP